MDPKPPRLAVVYSSGALRDLDEIWLWNAKEYGAFHADDYINFLKQGIDSLEFSYLDGKAIQGFSLLRHIVLKRSPRGDGHFVIYETQRESVNIIHVFHTKMDVHGRLRRERR